MQYYSLIGAIGFIAAIIILLQLFLLQSRDRRILDLKIHDASLTSEELEEHAKHMAFEQGSVKKSLAINWPVPRMNDNYKYIIYVYKSLNLDVQNMHKTSPAAEWLLDNFYIIEEQVKSIRRDLTKKQYSLLPILEKGPMRGYARIYNLALELVSHTNAKVDDKTLINYIKAYQTHSILTNQELWTLSIMIRIAIIEKLRFICEKIMQSRIQKRKADKLLDSIVTDGEQEYDKLIKALETQIKAMNEINPAFLEHLSYRIRKMGRSGSSILHIIDQRLAQFGTTLKAVTQKEHNDEAVRKYSIENCIISLKYISSIDWIEIFESLSISEKYLREDPDGTYPRMDLPSRNYYRNNLEGLARKYNVSESHVAQKILELSQKAKVEGMDERKTHVGYYIVDKGVYDLDKEMGYKCGIFGKIHGRLGKYPALLYLGSISVLTVLLVCFAARYALKASNNNHPAAIIAVLIAIIPASDIALNLVNWILSHSFKPAFIPKLELKDGIDRDNASMVVVPALLTDESTARELVLNLEVHYLANKDENLFFALLGDFRDADEETLPTDKRIADTALEVVRQLNEKHKRDEAPIFYFLCRHRQLNKRQNKWMGWERKRGALMEFNAMLLGDENTSYSIKSDDIGKLPKIKYVITLDADTMLPIDGAKRLIGTMMHTLNRPVIDKNKGIVVDGYGLLQPRIGVDLESANKSLFSRIFAGEYGIDPYSNAVSDIYQDLFGEGIFTGKGIYDLEVFYNLLKDAIPQNTVLSHDLLEGSYVRAGLVTDIELIDSFPSKYISFSNRAHRWVRGDWQLLRWLGPTVVNNKGNRVKNPLSIISRWKILDNIRRSLVSPLLMLIIVLGFGILPGNCFFWLGISVLAQAFPLVTGVIDHILSKKFRTRSQKRHIPVITGLKATLLRVLLLFIFLPHQAYFMSHAVLKTLYRLAVSRRNMLEWVPAAAVEKQSHKGVLSFWGKMRPSVFVALLVVVSSLIYKPVTLLVSVPLFLIWCSAPFVAWYISISIDEDNIELGSSDIQDLRKLARKTWRYFEEFMNQKNHYLPPDNYQEDPPNGIAYRTSPTNIGLGLLSAVTARDMGYIGTYELYKMVYDTISTVERMEKWNGHLLNWYDTRSLYPLRPRYVSTVDSGNFVGYLIVLSQSLQEYLQKPIFDTVFIQGLEDTISLVEPNNVQDKFGFESLAKLRTAGDQSLVMWARVLDEISANCKKINCHKSVWKSKVEHMMQKHKKELMEFARWIYVLESFPESAVNGDFEKQGEIPERLKKIIEVLKSNTTVAQIAEYGDILNELRNIHESLSGSNYNNPELFAWLEELSKAVAKSVENTGKFIEKYTELVRKIDKLADETEFIHLYDKKKQLFSIGYNIEDNELTNSYYDLLASEARQASYIAIARGEVEQKHWFRMGRTLTVIDYYKGLVSWSGTMFEYLMPLLIMKRYKNTLLDETYFFVVRSQKKYGKQRRVPWGTSESGFYSLDINLNYQYKAFGLPWLGLKRGLIEDMVVAPYATLLALPIDPEGAMENIRKLIKEGLDGPYGFYEAVDYTPERLPFGSNKGIVKSFMAHHQGMSLLSLNNFLNKDIMQERFHRDPVIKSAQLLLQEKVPTNIVFTKENKEKITPFKDIVYSEGDSVRIFKKPDPVIPRTHILSNGSYSVMVTDRGTGYSRCNNLDVTRWREDLTCDCYGMFFYIRNVETNTVWNAILEPDGNLPEKYSVTFTPDKAKFSRTDKDISTQTEIVVASGENAEIRMLSIANHGKTPAVIEVTSYMEIVLANHGGDVVHPAFSNLFIETEYVPEYRSLLAKRRPRADTGRTMWMVNTMVVEGDEVGGVQYETDRSNFIGRGHTAANPAAMVKNKPLSNTVGPVLDPIMSFRQLLRIEPGDTARISFITAVADSKSDLLEIAEKYQDTDNIEAAFRLALTRSRVEARYLNLKPFEMEIYQDMMSHILYISPLLRKKESHILKNELGQSSLWAFGISGDLPIVIVVLKKMDEVDIVYEVLKAHEYWRVKDLKVDLVILNEEEAGYTHPLQTLLADVVCTSHGQELMNKPGGVFIIKSNELTEAEMNLLYTAARIVLTSDGGYVYEQIQTPGELKLPPYKKFTRQPGDYGFAKPMEEGLEFFNGIGGFGKKGREYVIRLNESMHTPLPWVNVIANERMGFLITESGGGHTWFENSRENKITPWSNDPVSDTPGEVFYISDSDTGEIWTITPLPVREKTPYVIRHGFGYTVFEHASHGIEQSMTVFVPRRDPVKVTLVKLTNHTREERNLTLTYYIRPVLGVSDQFTARYLVTSTTGDNALMVENKYNDEFKGTVAFVDMTGNSKTITGNRKDFLGTGDLKSPEGLKRQKLSGTVGAGMDPCAAVQTNIKLAPSETCEVVLLLGMEYGRQEADELRKKYRDINTVKNSLEEVAGFWNRLLDTIRIKTPDNSMNLILNGWLLYQVIVCRLWARSAFYQSGGAFGYRDQLQDVMAVLEIWPELARRQILLHAAHQFVEGDVLHWWHEQGDKGTRTRYSDDYLWLPYVTSKYVKATGDFDILKETVPFLEGQFLQEHEHEIYIRPKVSSSTATLYEHCKRALEYGFKFGSHGLPLMGSGDWNDGMNLVGHEGKGESVWLGWFLYANIMDFLPLCEAMGDNESAERYKSVAENLVKSIEENAWDGSWYRRAYFDDGTPLGSVQNNECKIDSISQSWAVISKAANPERVAEAIDSLENYLVRRDEGLIKLLTPPFDICEPSPGYIKGYVPGVRENGGQYTHAAAWVILAFAMLGQGDKAWELFELINPINHSRTHIEYSRYKVEPYVMPADVYSVHPHTGRGGWTWYTGSAGWVYKVGIEYILGLKKNGEELVIDPCIPRHWPEFSMEYRYGRSLYQINVKNPKGVNKGVVEVAVDGVQVESESGSIKLVDDGKTHNVVVTLG